jgi:hypothetical protein
MKNIFTDIVSNRRWDPSVPCGSGSSLEYTLLLRQALPKFLARHQINSMIDVPCGDFSWMSLVPFAPEFQYIGGDIVEFMIENNQKTWPQKQFRVFDLTQDALPDVDLLFCRDCLFHLSEHDLSQVFDNIRSSNVKYVMTTSYISGHFNNHNIVTGGFRPISLEHTPFNLPAPLDSLEDGPTGAVVRKMCLWKRQDFDTVFK